MNLTGMFTSAKFPSSQPKASLTKALTVQDKPLWAPTNTVVACASAGILFLMSDFSMRSSVSKSSPQKLVTGIAKSVTFACECGSVLSGGSNTDLSLMPTRGLKIKQKPSLYYIIFMDSNGELKYHFYVKRQRRICTMWPRILFTCRLLFIISTPKLAVSQSF